jgi:hypothetical protein
MDGSGHRVRARERPDPRVAGQLRSPDIRASASWRAATAVAATPGGPSSAPAIRAGASSEPRGPVPGARATGWPGPPGIRAGSARMSLMLRRFGTPDRRAREFLNEQGDSGGNPNRKNSHDFFLDIGTITDLGNLTNCIIQAHYPPCQVSKISVAEPLGRTFDHVSAFRPRRRGRISQSSQRCKEVGR